MAAAGSITITGSITGLPGGSEVISGLITTSAAVGQVLMQNLNSGADTTVPIPLGTTSVYMQPPSTNAVLVLLKYAAGDTGLPLHKTMPTLISVDPSATAIILHANGALSGPMEMLFL